GPRQLWMWPNARISVMGGAQAANTLATVRRETARVRGEQPTDDAIAAYEAEILATYEHEGSPYYATARLWDDGVIAPADTRQVLALGLAAALNAPIERTTFGVFRM